MVIFTQKLLVFLICVKNASGFMDAFFLGRFKITYDMYEKLKRFGVKNDECINY